MKKILIVIGCLGIGGGERSLVNLLNLFDYKKYSIDLLIFNKRKGFQNEIPSQVNIINAPFSLEILYNSISNIQELNLKSLYLTLLRLMATGISRLKTKNMNQAKQYRWKNFYKKRLECFPEKYETVFAYMNDDSMYYVADKVQANHKIAWVHTDYRAMGYDPEIDRNYFEKFEKVVTISDECLNILKFIFPEYKEKFLVIPNLTSKQVVLKRATEFFPEEYKSINEEKILLSIGRLSVEKGIDLAILAAEKMKQRGIKFIWFVLGDGELKRELKKDIKRKGLVKEFRLLGTRANPYPYLKHCNLFVQTSRIEGKSVALDEAKLLAKPIVATKYPTVYDQIEDHRNGMLVDSDGQAIANGIIQLLSDNCLQNTLIRRLKKEEQGNVGYINAYYNLIE